MAELQQTHRVKNFELETHIRVPEGIKDHEDVIHRPTGVNMDAGKIHSFVMEHKENLRKQAQKDADDAVTVANQFVNQHKALRDKLLALGLDPDNLPDSLSKSNRAEVKPVSK